MRLLDQAWIGRALFVSGPAKGKARDVLTSNLASPEAGALGQTQPGRRLRSGPLLVDAEEDVADEGDMPQLRLQ